jgi:hypothetical protein
MSETHDLREKMLRDSIKAYEDLGPDGRAKLRKRRLEFWRQTEGKRIARTDGLPGGDKKWDIPCTKLSTDDKND